MSKKDKENKPSEELNITKEQVEGVLESIETTDADTPIYYTDPLLVESDALDGVGFDKEEFQRGLKDSSYYAGMYSGYLSVGMSNIDAYALVISDLQKKMSIETSQINANATIEASKNQMAVLEKNSL